MEKDFGNWNTLKEKIHQKSDRKFYHAREIWWCSLGVNVGHEQDGGGKTSQRPVLIVKGLGSETCLIVPLTTSAHTHPYRISLGKIGEENASVIILQIRVIDTKRLVEKIEWLDKDVFERIRKAIKDML